MFKSLLVSTTLLFGTSAVADQIQFLPHGPQALSSVLSTIQSARQSVELSYYIFEPCSTAGKMILKNLAAKARQGVKVRAVIDAQPLKAADRDHLASFFAKHRMGLKFYNDTFMVHFGTNLRSHIKFIVADGSTYVSGGRNVDDGYYGMATDINYVDRDVLVKGNSGAQVVRSFNEMWNSWMVSEGNSTLSDQNVFEGVCLKEDATYKKAAQYISTKAATLKTRTNVHSCSNVRFVTDNPEFSSTAYGEAQEGNNDFMTHLRLREKRTTAEVLNFFNGSARKLEIENWSYMPAHQLDQAFASLRTRKVAVQVITNGAAGAGGMFDGTFDHIMKYYVERDTTGSQGVLQISRKGGMNDAHELTPKSSAWKIHSKVAVRDNRDVLVSSFNLDPRSYHTNLESAVVAERCDGLAKDLQAGFETLKNNFKKDRVCKDCNAEASPSYLMRVLGWMSHEFL